MQILFGQNLSTISFLALVIPLFAAVYIVHSRLFSPRTRANEIKLNLMMKLVFSRSKKMTASPYNQLYQNYVSLHTAETTFPYSGVFHSLPSSTFPPSNSMPFQTESCFPDVWIYQQTLGHYLKWIHPKYTNFEYQPSLIKREICEINNKRPSVIHSTGRVLPLNEAGTVLSLPSLGPLDVNHNKQLSNKRLVHYTYENQKTSDPKHVTDETCATTISVLDSVEERRHRFHCRFCNKPYHWRSHWKAHERIHTGERPFKCEICGKTFTRSDGLQCHRNTHSRKKDSVTSMFKNEEYVQNKTLKTDELFHDGNDRPSEGEELKPEGKKHFKNRFQNHQVNFSKVEKDFHCQLCRKSFYSSNGLQHHLRRHGEGARYGNVHQRC